MMKPPPVPGDQTGARRKPSKSYWAAVLVLAAIVGAMGLYPHVRLSQAVGELTYCLYSYDEGFYSTGYLEQPPGPGRVLSSTVLRALFAIGGGDRQLVLVAVDFVFPFLLTLSAGALAASISFRLPLRVAVVLGLLFGAEAATALFRGWPSWTTLVAGDGRAYVVEAAPILYAFRTPDPQLGWIVGFAFLSIVVRVVSSGRKLRPGVAALFAACCVALGLGYSFVFAACLIFAGLSAGLLLLQRRTPPALVLIGGCILAVVVHLITHFASAHNAGATTGLVFSTRGPCLSPLAIVSVATLIGWLVPTILRVRHPARVTLGIAAALVPMIALNQQVITGLSVYLKVWEENTNHVFVAISMGLLVSVVSETARGSRRQPGVSRRVAGHLIGVVLTVTLLWFAVKRQTLVREWMWPSNAEQVAVAELLDANAELMGPNPRVLFDTLTMPQSLGIRSEREHDVIVSFDDGYVDRVPMIEEDASRTGVGSPHADALFEFMWRRGVDRATLAALLEKEAAEHAHVLTLLYNFRDVWGPMTTWRKRRADEIAAQLPSVLDAFDHYRAEAARTERRRAWWVSLRTPDDVAAISDWTCQRVDERPTVDGRTMYLYRQDR